MSPEDKGTGGSDNTPPGANDPAALQTKLTELTGQLADLNAQYAEAQKRSAGKDAVITKKSQEVDQVLGQLGALEAEAAAKIATTEAQVKRLLEAVGNFEELSKQSLQQSELLQAELVKQKAETARLLAISHAGIAPELVDLVQPSDDPAVLEASIKKAQAAQKAISDRTKADIAQFGVLPTAPQPIGESGVVVDLGKLFEGATGNQALIEAATAAYEAAKKAGLKADDSSWMKETRTPIEA